MASLNGIIREWRTKQQQNILATESERENGHSEKHLDVINWKSIANVASHYTIEVSIFYEWPTQCRCCVYEKKSEKKIKICVSEKFLML